MGGLSVRPKPSWGKQHQPNDWIIEWPNETACAAERINRLHHSPLSTLLPLSPFPAPNFSHSFFVPLHFSFVSLLFLLHALTMRYFVLSFIACPLFLSLFARFLSIPPCCLLPFSIFFFLLLSFLVCLHIFSPPLFLHKPFRLVCLQRPVTIFFFFSFSFCRYGEAVLLFCCFKYLFCLYWEYDIPIYQVNIRLLLKQTLPSQCGWPHDGYDAVWRAMLILCWKRLLCE